MQKKDKMDIRITVTLSSGEKITATMGLLNDLSTLAQEAAYWNNDYGYCGCAAAAKKLSNEIYAALDARGFYDNVNNG